MKSTISMKFLVAAIFFETYISILLNMTNEYLESVLLYGMNKWH